MTKRKTEGKTQSGSGRREQGRPFSNRQRNAPSDSYGTGEQEGRAQSSGKRGSEERRQSRSSRRGGSTQWLYGIHAVMAAIANSKRPLFRVMATADLAERAQAAAHRAPIIVTERTAIDRLLPPGAVHQGIAAEVGALPGLGVEDAVALARDRPHALVLVLDQVTDPQNVGAVLRNAAAFGATAVVVPEHNSPEATGSVAKAAAGALEIVPLIRATNLRRAMEILKAGGFWCVGLAGEADVALSAYDMKGKTALILGAEGEGLRRLTRETCDHLLRIPIRPQMESLNVAATAAVALYEWVRQTEPA